jgi:hypothetical protein
MKPQTQAMLSEIMKYAETGKDIYPFMFQPKFGRSNTVSAAIRHALKNKMIEKSGVDGMGKPKYKKFSLNKKILKQC